MKNKQVKNGAVCYIMTVHSWRHVVKVYAHWKQHLTELKIKWLAQGGKSTMHVFVCSHRAENRKLVMAAGERTQVYMMCPFF
jgi:hypothetical protein